MKHKGMEAKLTRVKADKKTLRDKIVQMKGVEQSQQVDYVELSDNYAQNASRVAQLTAKNEWLRSERDTACTAQAKGDTEVERLSALVNARTAESPSPSEFPRSLRTQSIILSLSKAGEKYGGGAAGPGLCM